MASGEELFNQITEFYPYWVANQSWLMFGFPSGWCERSLASPWMPAFCAGARPHR
jgi:hypothetical protein